MVKLTYTNIKTELERWVLDPTNIESIAEQLHRNQSEHNIKSENRIDDYVYIGDYVCDVLTNSRLYNSKAFNYRNPFKAVNDDKGAVFDTLAIVIPRIAGIPVSELNDRFSDQYYDAILADKEEFERLQTLWDGFTEDKRNALINGIMPGAARGAGKQQFEIAREAFWEQMKDTLKAVHLKKILGSFTKDPSKDTKMRSAVSDAMSDINAIPTAAPIGGYHNWLRNSIAHEVFKKKPTPAEKKSSTKDPPTTDPIIDEETQVALNSLLPFITEFLSGDGKIYYDTTKTGLKKQRNAWEMSGQNLFILISRYLGNENFDTIDLRTGKHHATVSNRQDFNVLKNRASDFLKLTATDDKLQVKDLVDPRATSRDTHKSRVIYELFHRVLGSSKLNNTQIKKGTFWQTHYFKVILKQWIASLNAAQRAILIELVDTENSDGYFDPLLKPFIVENRKLKVNENVTVKDFQEFFQALLQSS